MGEYVSRTTLGARPQTRLLPHTCGPMHDSRHEPTAHTRKYHEVAAALVVEAEHDLHMLQVAHCAVRKNKGACQRQRLRSHQFPLAE